MIQFTRIQHTAHTVAIVASGPSLKGFDLSLLRAFDVIAVNASILHLPFAPRFWFTLDTSLPQRAIMRTAPERPETTFYAAVYPFYCANGQRRPDLAPPLEDRIRYLKRIENPGIRGSRIGLSTDPGGIYVGNSAYGALGLAYLMGAKRIALFGVDGTGGYAWGDGRPKNLRNLRDLFASSMDFLAKAGVDVVVGSPESVVDCWPRTTPDAAVEWLARENERAA